MKKACKYCGKVIEVNVLLGALVKHTNKSGEICKGSLNISALAMNEQEQRTETYTHLEQMELFK